MQAVLDTFKIVCPTTTFITCDGPSLVSGIPDETMTHSLAAVAQHPSRLTTPETRADYQHTYHFRDWTPGAEPNFQFWARVAEQSRCNTMLHLGVFEGRSVGKWRDAAPWVDTTISFDCGPALGWDIMHAVTATAVSNLAGAPLILGMTSMTVPVFTGIMNQMRQRAGLVYIDASHHADDVARDALACWAVLAPGGVMVFDDYDQDYDPSYSTPGANSPFVPMRGVHAFLALVGDEVEMLPYAGASTTQLAVRRRSEPTVMVGSFTHPAPMNHGLPLESRANNRFPDLTLRQVTGYPKPVRLGTEALSGLYGVLLAPVNAGRQLVAFPFAEASRVLNNVGGAMNTPSANGAVAATGQALQGVAGIAYAVAQFLTAWL